MTSTPAPTYRCEICGRADAAASERELRLHLIRHGSSVVAHYLGRPDLACRATWGRTLRGAVASMARRGATLQ